MMIFDRYRNKSKRTDEKTTLKKSSLANSFLKKFPIHLTKIGWHNRQSDDNKVVSAINQPRPSTSLPNIPLAIATTTVAPASSSSSVSTNKKPSPAAAVTVAGRRTKAPHKSKSLVLPPTHKKRHSAEPRKRLALTSSRSIRHSYTFGHLSKNASKLTISDLELDEKQKARLDKLIESAKTCPQDPQALLLKVGSRKSPTPHRSISHQHLSIQPIRQSLNRAHSDSHAKPKQLDRGQAITSEDLVALLRKEDANITLIDVRNLMEYQKGHIRGSFNVNLPSLLVKRYQRGTVSNFNIENFITTPEGKAAYTCRTKDKPTSNDITTINNTTPSITTPITTLSTATTTSTTSSTTSSILEQKAIMAEKRKSNNNKSSTQHQQNNDSSSNNNNNINDNKESNNIWVIYDDHMSEDDLTTQAWTLVHVMERSIGKGLVYYLEGGFNSFEEEEGVSEDLLDSIEPVAADATHAATTHHRNNNNAGIVLNNPINIPRRSVSYTIGESKNDLHRRTSLFSLDTQAARVNNANALARRAKRRSKQKIVEEEQDEAVVTDASPRTETEFGFVISEIIPGFLFVGPEIETVEQATQLDDRKIKRVLNMAEECNDDVEGLKERMLYRKISARDTVEMKNIELVMMEAVHFIEEAKKNHEPIYVHCKAGKSRSITAILAYLVTSELWTLKRAYRHVIKARPNMSPNIGFISELMKIEGRVHGRISSFMETDWQSTSLPSPEYANELLQLEKAWKPSQEHFLVKTE